MKYRESTTVRGLSSVILLSARIAIAIGALVGASSMCLLGQSETQASSASVEPVFASISVTIDSSDVRSYGTRASADKFSARNETVRMLIELAYGVDGSGIVGLPKWGDEEHFDIEAAVDGSIAEQIEKLDGGANVEVSRRITEGVLENAFGLVAHHETLDVPVYELHTINDGPKCLNMAVPDPYSGSRTLVSTKTGISGPYITMPSLAMLLADHLGALVVDKTGLAGGYRINLHWATESDAPPVHLTPELSPSPPIVEALKQQLGLTLRKGEGAREVLVVDRLERPRTE